MLDPKTLKAGDIVVFGGKVEKEITHCFHGGISFNGHHSAYEDDPIWQIAELKKPELPVALMDNLLILHSNSKLYKDAPGVNWCSSASYLLGELKQAVKALENAGVVSE